MKMSMNVNEIFPVKPSYICIYKNANNYTCKYTMFIKTMCETVHSHTNNISYIFGGGRFFIAALAFTFKLEYGTHIAFSAGSPRICTK